MAKTFAQYLIEQIIPADIKITKPLDKNETERILKEVHAKHPSRYSTVVSDLKRLGDTLSTYESITFGMQELEAPNRVKRNAIIKSFKNRFDKETDHGKRMTLLEQVQDAVATNDLSNPKDEASTMVLSGGMGGKRMQLMKLRSSPVVLKDHKGNLVEEMIDRSYAEGFKPLDYWNGAAEARANLVEGQVSTSVPGVVNKRLNNLMGGMVVSTEDCNTHHGVQLNTKDDDIIDRYIAKTTGTFRRNTVITPDTQKAMIKAGLKEILVRSPQTCSAIENTVCSKCMGLSVDQGKPYAVGTNVGTRSAGAMSEVATQLTLSAKHSTTLAKRDEGLKGIEGFNAVTQMPKIFPNKKIICEVFGEVWRVIKAPQGGHLVQIRETKKVPERYIVNAKPIKGMTRHWEYYIPPVRKLVDGIEAKAQVFPGMELTDGNNNLKDVARLRGLGLARSAAAEEVYSVYKNTGHKLDRRHFEMFSRALLNNVRIEKAPPGFPLRRGEVVQYNKLRDLASRINGRSVSIDAAAGMVLAEEVAGMLIGTDITPQIQDQLRKAGVKKVKITTDLETSPVVASLEQAQLLEDNNVLGKLNHRNLQDTLKGAARMGQVQDIHSYSPIAAYAYGVELSNRSDGRY